MSLCFCGHVLSTQMIEGTVREPCLVSVVAEASEPCEQFCQNLNLLEIPTTGLEPVQFSLTARLLACPRSHYF